MAAKGKKIHGFRVHATLFFDYDPTKPESITAAATRCGELAKDFEAVGATVEKITAPEPASISAPAPAPDNKPK